MQSLNEHSDAKLIHFFLEGREDALQTLILRHKDRIYTAIFMLVRDRYLAEDLFQETFLKIIRTMREGRYSEQGKFLPWAIRVAHNLCMDYFRRVRQHVAITLPDGRDIAALISYAHESPEAALERRQTHTRVRELIATLPEEQREVIVLRMYGNLSFKEISRLTNVSINTALGRMRYGLINLRRLIAEKQMVLR